MSVTRKNLKRLATLSAVGAGALAVSADQAEAGIISGTVSSPNTVGWNDPQTALSSLAFTVTSGVNITAQRQQTVNGSASSYYYLYRSIKMVGGTAAFRWRTAGGGGGNRLLMVDSGQTWSAGGYSGGAVGSVGKRTWSYTSGDPAGSDVYGLSPFSNKYALFRFKPGSDFYYGWVELSYTVSAGFGEDGALGPLLTVHRWAYQNTPNTFIGAGETDPVPEPGTFALAALALGALGMRRWRSAKETPAA